MAFQQSIGASFRKSVASLGLAMARMAGYDAAKQSITHKQASRVNTNPNSAGAQIERLMLTWNAEDALKNIPLATAYIQIRRMYCSPQAWLPNTGDPTLNHDVKQYCEDEWETMGVNCSMWEAFSRTASVEAPCRGDAGMYWFRDMNGKLKLIEFSADQLGELYQFVRPYSDVNGLQYFAGLYSDPSLGGENVGYKIYDRGYNQTYSNPQKIPASDVLFFQDNLLRGNRGISVFAQSLLTLGKTENLYQHAIDSANLQSKRGVLIKNQMGSPYNELSYDTKVNTDGSVVYIERSFDGAQTEYMYDGDSYEVTKVEQPGEAVIKGIKWGAKLACLTWGFTYSFAVDSEDTGGAPIRLDIGKADKQISRVTRIDARQLKKIAFVTIMNGVNNRVFTGSALSKNLTRGLVQFPTGPTVDAFRDDKSSIMFQRAGLTSAQRIMGQTRDDPQEVVDENKDWALMTHKAAQDANRQLKKDGYEETITIMDIGQVTDNMSVTSPADQDREDKQAKQDAPAKAAMAAYMGDVSVSDLPQSTQDDISGIMATNGSAGALKVVKYGMVPSELESMADPHNLESANHHIRYTPNHACSDEVHENKDKHILINNGRIIDGHHHLAKAIKGKVTKSLPVLDLTPARFQTAAMRADYDPSEARDNDGKWTTGGGAATKKKATPEEKKAEADHKFEGLMEGKSEPDQNAFRAARADGIAIPPAWTDIKYYGKDADTIARGRDDKGRRQVAENPEYRQRISDENNARISKDLTPRMTEIRNKLREDAKAGNEEAKVLYLITQSGFRIGGKGDGKAKIEAFGASSLMGDHVKSDENGAHFDFLGKKGVRQQHSVSDPVIQDFVKSAEPGKPLFSTTAEKVRAAWQDKYGGEKVHDIRHVVATELASSELEKRLSGGRPKNEKEKISLMKSVSTVVGSKLGNNPAQALGTYIDPKIWTRI